METQSRYVLRYISDIPLLICATVPINNCWMFELNKVGALIWKQLKNTEIENIVQTLENEMKIEMTDEQKDMIKYYCIKLEELGVV